MSKSDKLKRLQKRVIAHWLRDGGEALNDLATLLDILLDKGNDE